MNVMLTFNGHTYEVTGARVTGRDVDTRHAHLYEGEREITGPELDRLVDSAAFDDALYAAAVATVWESAP